MTHHFRPLLAAAVLMAAQPAAATVTSLLAPPFSWSYFGAGLTFSNVYVSGYRTPTGGAGGAIQTVSVPIWAKTSGPPDGDPTKTCTGGVTCEQIGSLKFQYALWQGSQQSYAINRVGAVVFGGFQLTDAADTNGNFSFLQVYHDASTINGTIDGGNYFGKYNGMIPRWNSNPANPLPGWNTGASEQYQFFDVPYDLVGISPKENVTFETALATLDPTTSTVSVLADFTWSFDTATGALTGQPIVFDSSASSNLLSLYANGFPGVRYLNDVLSPITVPEPGTWAMMLLGFGLVGAAARGSRQSRIGRAVSTRAIQARTAG